MTLEEAQRRVEELMMENKKLQNRVDFLEKTMQDEVIGDYDNGFDDDDDYFDYERYSD